jgi:hypothetical protein
LVFQLKNWIIETKLVISFVWFIMTTKEKVVKESENR